MTCGFGASGTRLIKFAIDKSFGARFLDWRQSSSRGTRKISGIWYFSNDSYFWRENKWKQIPSLHRPARPFRWIDDAYKNNLWNMVLHKNCEEKDYLRHPLSLQRRYTGNSVIRLNFNFSWKTKLLIKEWKRKRRYFNTCVNDVDDVIDGDAGLSKICRQDDLAFPWRWSQENTTLVAWLHAWMQRENLNKLFI